jgi:hypothetical protein
MRRKLNDDKQVRFSVFDVLISKCIWKLTRELTLINL